MRREQQESAQQVRRASALQERQDRQERLDQQDLLEVQPARRGLRERLDLLEVRQGLLVSTARREQLVQPASGQQARPVSEQLVQQVRPARPALRVRPARLVRPAQRDRLVRPELLELLERRVPPDRLEQPERRLHLARFNKIGCSR